MRKTQNLILVVMPRKFKLNQPTFFCNDVIQLSRKEYFVLKMLPKWIQSVLHDIGCYTFDSEAHYSASYTTDRNYRANISSIKDFFQKCLTFFFYCSGAKMPKIF